MLKAITVHKFHREEMFMEIVPMITHRFVKSEDLNHHGTLFAGRTAEWFVEAGLIATAVYLPSENIVCAKIHGMNFSRPVKLGETVKLLGKVVYTGKSSIVSSVHLYVRNEEILNGFITFVNVDQEGCPFPHGIKIQATSEEDVALQEAAKNLKCH